MEISKIKKISTVLAVLMIAIWLIGTEAGYAGIRDGYYYSGSGGTSKVMSAGYRGAKPRIIEEDTQIELKGPRRGAEANVQVTSEPVVTTNYEATSTVVDTEVLIATPPPRSPDINNDGIVDILDLSLLAYCWGTTKNGNGQYDDRFDHKADFNRDDKIDSLDLDYFVGFWHAVL